ncbi:MAG: hypothetical protein HUU16_00410 [Candidatus Omnitrophica bacterium]|nr:hypothetical protein [bacterium]NUN94611.1 hypothetical protein [Candidatus Omnitrophota bacterium]
MKNYALALLILLPGLPSYSAQLSNLVPGAAYLVWQDGFPGETMVAGEGSLTVTLPAGYHKVALEFVSANPTPIPTVTEDPTPVATASPSVEPTPSATPTEKREGNEVLVASFDQESGRNRFEILDENGNSLNGVIEVLEGVSVPGEIKAADLDGDSVLEVVAAGWNSERGVVVEFWTGNGQMLSSADVFPVDFQDENYLLTGDFDGIEGLEAILVGRAGDGSYRSAAVSLSGEVLGDEEILPAGYSNIESLFTSDVDGDGVGDLVVLARNASTFVEMKVVSGNLVETSVVVFGNGYTGKVSGFPLDTDGDGILEIGCACRNANTSDFRLLVLSHEGTVVLKQNFFPGKFEDNATFTASDLNSDGRSEITALGRMTTTGSNVIQVVDGSGDRLFSRTVLDPSYSGVNSSVLADLNGDGVQELVVAGSSSVSGEAAYQVFEIDGNLIAGGTAFESAATPALASSDLDENGSEELLILGEFEDGACGLEMRDGQSGEVRFTTTFSTSPSLVMAGDMI